MPNSGASPTCSTSASIGAPVRSASYGYIAATMPRPSAATPIARRRGPRPSTRFFQPVRFVRVLFIDYLLLGPANDIAPPLPESGRTRPNSLYVLGLHDEANGVPARAQGVARARIYQRDNDLHRFEAEKSLDRDREGVRTRVFHMKNGAPGDSRRAVRTTGDWRLETMNPCAGSCRACGSRR